MSPLCAEPNQPAAAFFLRQPSRTNPTRPVANNGRALGRGTTVEVASRTPGRPLTSANHRSKVPDPMVTEVGEPTIWGTAADVGNRSPGQLAMVQVVVSVPATNRLTPSSWVTEKISVVDSINVNRKTVACANPDKLRGLVRHATEIQVPGVGAAGVSEAKKPGIVLRAVSL